MSDKLFDLNSAPEQEKQESASEQKDLTPLADRAESVFLDKVNAQQAQAAQNTSSSLSFDKAILPNCMAESKHFIVSGGGTNGKQPMQLWKNALTWKFFDDAIKSSGDNGCIAYVFPSGNPVIGIDFDHVILDGRPIPEFVELFNFLLNGQVKTYIEFSKSGTGLHLFLKDVSEAIVLPDQARKYFFPDGTECPFWTETFGNKGSLKPLLLTGNAISDAHKSVIANGADADILLRAIQAWAYPYLQKESKAVYESQYAKTCDFPSDFDISSLNPKMQAILKTQYSRVAESKEGCGNIVLNTSALILGHYCPQHITEGLIKVVLESAAMKCGLTDRDGIGGTDATIASGLKKGMSEPQELGQFKQVEGLPLKELRAMPVEAFDVPVTFASDVVPEIDTQILPKPLATIVDELASKLELPPSLVLVPALAVAAIVAMRKYRVEINATYSVPLTFYGLGIAAPSNKKSSIFEFTKRILDDIAREENDKTAVERERNSELRKSFAHAITVLEEGKRKDIKDLMLPKSDTKKEKSDDVEETKISLKDKIKEINDSYMQKIDEIRREMPDTIDETSFYIGGDATFESVFLLAEKSDGYMSILDEEGKLFEILTGLYSDGKTDTDLLAKGYDSSTVTRCRASEIKESGEPKKIEHAHLTCSFIIQPSVFQDMAKLSNRKVRGRGVYGRFVIAYPETYIGHRKWENLPIDKTAFADFNSAIKRIYNHELFTNQLGEEEKDMLRPSNEAAKVGNDFIKSIEVLMGPGGELETVQDWAGKLTGHVHRLAGLYHLFTDEGREGSLVISEKTMEAATYTLTVLAHHALKFFDALSASQDILLAKKMASWLAKQDTDVVSQRDLQQRFKSTHQKLEQIRAGIEVLLDRSYLFPVESEENTGPGKPKGPTYFINPRLREVG